MVQVIAGKVVTDDVTRKAMGGTELMAHEMVKRIDPELLKDFHIVHSRLREIPDTSKKLIFVAHDLAGDPEADHLKNGGYNRFEKIVFVSNWQMQSYISYYGIPWYKCIVMQNAIEPLSKRAPSTDNVVRLVYHTTPHRGLNILANVFSNLVAEDKNIHLDVFSSFKIYGWEERDAEYAPVFDFLKEHDQVTYHGSVPHEKLVKYLPTFDIFAYPCIWPETSCISMIEAMSAGLLVVHPNFAALPETAANWTYMYQFHENVKDHTVMFYHVLKSAIEAMREGRMENRLANQSAYTDMFYNWDLRAIQWEQLLRSIN